MTNWQDALDEALNPGKGRDGKIHENGLRAHLQVVHGYARTRLTGLETIKLVMKHQSEHRGNPGHE